MDSQENILEQGKQEEAAQVAATSVEETIQEAAAPEVETATETPKAPEAPESSDDSETIEASETPEAPVERKVYETKLEVLERVKEIAHGEEAPQKDEVDYLKTAFYKLHIAEREAKLKAYIDGGGDPEKYQITPDED